MLELAKFSLEWFNLIVERKEGKKKRKKSRSTQLLNLK